MRVLSCWHACLLGMPPQWLSDNPSQSNSYVTPSLLGRAYDFALSMRSSKSIALGTVLRVLEAYRERNLGESSDLLQRTLASMPRGKALVKELIQLAQVPRCCLATPTCTSTRHQAVRIAADCTHGDWRSVFSVGHHGLQCAATAAGLPHCGLCTAQSKASRHDRTAGAAGPGRGPQQ